MPEHDRAEVAVTGATGVSIDISNKLGAALVPYLSLIVGLALLLLMLVFRSILVPLKATLGFLLTVAATFGVLVAVFQWSWLAGPFGIEGQTGPVALLGRRAWCLPRWLDRLLPNVDVEGDALRRPPSRVRE